MRIAFLTFVALGMSFLLGMRLETMLHPPIDKMAILNTQGLSFLYGEATQIQYISLPPACHIMYQADDILKDHLRIGDPWEAEFDEDSSGNHLVSELRERCKNETHHLSSPSDN